MPIVDVHTHVLPRDFLSTYHSIASSVGSRLIDNQNSVEVALGDVSLGSFPFSFVDLEARTAAMANSGIALHVLSSPPFMFGYDLEPILGAEVCAAFNDSAIRWARECPDRFRVLASLPLQDVALSLAELRRVQDYVDVVGIATGATVNGQNIGSGKFEPVLAAMAAADLPLLIHPNISGGDRLAHHFLRNLVGNPLDTTIAGADLLLGGTLERHPSLRVCLVHGGGFLPYQLGRLVHGHKTVVESRHGLTRPLQESLGQLYFDTVLHSPKALRFMGEQVGWSQVVMGSDFPFKMGDSEPALTLRTLGLAVTDHDRVASHNAVRFLRGTLKLG